MKKLIFILLYFFFTVKTSAQSLYLGSRDNYYIHIGYIDKSHWYIFAEQSIFSSKIKNQTITGYLGYSNLYKKIAYNMNIYSGMKYNSDYSIVGSEVSLKYQFPSIISIYTALRGHYDSTIGYNTCYLLGVNLKILEDLSFTTQYTNIPEYRMIDERIKVGMIFKKNNLWIKPEISIPIKDKKENLRYLLSFGYQIKLIKK